MATRVPGRCSDGGHAGAGAYVSEADYFQRDWQQAYWGANYPRLAAIKRRYDPGNLFHGHQTVEPA